MHTRDDHVITVCYPDHTTVVEHADGTRITTVMRDVSTIANESEAFETGLSIRLVVRLSYETALHVLPVRLSVRPVQAPNSKTEKNFSKPKLV